MVDVAVTKNVSVSMPKGRVPLIVSADDVKVAHVAIVIVEEREAVYVSGRHGVVVNSTKVTVNGVFSSTDTVEAVPPYGAFVNSQIVCKVVEMIENEPEGP